MITLLVLIALAEAQSIISGIAVGVFMDDKNKMSLTVALLMLFFGLVEVAILFYHLVPGVITL